MCFFKSFYTKIVKFLRFNRKNHPSGERLQPVMHRNWWRRVEIKLKMENEVKEVKKVKILKSVWESGSLNVLSRPESLVAKWTLRKPQRLMIDEQDDQWRAGGRRSSQSEGLLGRVVVKGGGNVRPLIQFVIFQMELLETERCSILILMRRSVWNPVSTHTCVCLCVCVHLGHLPPVEAVKEVVGPPLIAVGLQRWFHARSPGDPDPLLFMIPPVSVETGHTHRS